MTFTVGDTQVGRIPEQKQPQLESQSDLGLESAQRWLLLQQKGGIASCDVFS
jgi:hypothetical protein